MPERGIPAIQNFSFGFAASHSPKPGNGRDRIFCDLGNVQRRVRSAGRTGKIQGRTRLDVGLHFRPALGQQLTDLPARQFFRAGDVKQARAILRRQFPNRPRRFAGENRAAKFVREQFHFPARLQGEAQLFVETAIARA